MKTLLTAEELSAGVDRLAAEIAAHYRDEPLTIVGILTGSIVLLADVIRRVDLPIKVGLIQASSYRGTATEPGELLLNLEKLPDVTDRHVLLLDDIFDTGRTLSEVVDRMRDRGALSIRSAVLLRKQGRQQVALEPEHVVFRIPDAFVVGYGLDYADAYRNLPFVAALEEGDM
ncbi:MAG: hypoxanthine phosphoribosyltransferase [Pirellulales bacterium]